jgi:sec-independent protein translocase protein TatC
MTLIEHLYELRRRVFWAALAVLIGAILGFLWFQYNVFGLPSLGRLLTGPYCSLPGGPNGVRADFGAGQACRLLATRPFEAFLLQFKAGTAVGAVLASPFWLYQLWAFVAPGLYARERKFALSFVALAAVLFAAGAVLAYLVVAQGLQVLLGFGGGQVVTALTGDNYFSFILAMLLIFGVSFELPLLVVMLNRVGVLTYERLKSWQRGIIFGLFVFAAVATPSQDPLSMTALAGTLTVLFYLSLFVARAHDRRKQRQEEADGLANLDPDQPSALDLSVPPVEPAAPMTAEPVPGDWDPAPGPVPSGTRSSGFGDDPIRYDDAT